MVHKGTVDDLHTPNSRCNSSPEAERKCWFPTQSREDYIQNIHTLTDLSHLSKKIISRQDI